MPHHRLGAALSRLPGILSLGRNALVSNLVRQRFPYKLTYAVTYRCNYRCQTCEIWRRRPAGELTTEEVATFFERSNHFNWIDFTGGEPWLRKDFVDLVAAALSSCRRLALLHFPTNGYLSDRIVSGVKTIMALGPPRFIITVSLDGDRELNDRIRGMEGGWQRQLETFRRLREIAGVDVVLGMTLSKHNAGRAAATLAAARRECPDLRPEDLHLNLAHESAHFYGNAGAFANGHPPALQEEILAHRAMRRRRWGPVGFLEDQYLSHLPRFMATGKTPLPCHALRSSCFLDPRGTVYPCSTYDHELGNIRDHDLTLETIWQRPDTRRLQREIWRGTCPQCWTPCEAYQTILGHLARARPALSWLRRAPPERQDDP